MERRFLTALLITATIFLWTIPASGQADADTLLKSKTSYLFRVSEGSASGNGVIISKEIYNRNGLLEEFFKYNDNGDIKSEIVYHYNDLNQVTECITSVPATGFTTTVKYQYNKGLLVRALGTNNKRDTKITMDYLYNEDKKVKEMITRSEDNSIYKRIASEYDEKGRKVRLMMYDAEGNLIGEEYTDYDISTIKEKKLSAREGFDQIIEKKLDEAGNITRENVLDIKERLLSSKNNVYDEKGRLVEVHSNIPSARMSSKIRNVYDEKDNIIEQVHYNKFDEPVKIVRTEYVYYSEK